MNRSRLHSLWNIAAALLACAGFVSCSQDELAEQGTPLPVGQYPLELTAGGLQAVATPPQPATRGTMDGDWDGVERVTVMVNNEEEKTKEYKVDASEDKRTASLIPEVPLANDDTPFWWQSTTETKTVTAWAPYEYVLFEWFDLPTKWEKDHFAKYDIIGVRKDIQFTDDPKSLEFRHLMAKVVINLRKTEYLENAKKVDVQLLNHYKTVRLEISSNQLQVYGEGDGSNVTPYHLPAETYEEVDFGNGHREKPFASYTALVRPMNTTNTNVLQVAVDGATYLVTKDALGQGGMLGSVKYTAGQTTTINLTIKGNELDVSIDYKENIGWGTDGNTGSGEVELP